MIKKTNFINEEKLAWLFLIPFFTFYALFTLYPILGAFLTSFQVGTFTKLKFDGFGNYVRLFSDKILHQTFINTFLFVIVSTVLYVILAMLFALWAQKTTRLSTIIRICIYVPTILTISVMTNTWKILFRPEIGVWGYLTKGIGDIASWNWLRDVVLGRWTIVLSTMWWTVGTNMLIIVASLRSIPRDLYEASSLDGAGELRQFFSITLPHLYPVMRLLVVLQTLLSFKLFGQSFLLTGGAPNHMTRSIVLYIYDVGFGARNPGYAAAISIALMLILIFLSVMQMKLMKHKG